MATSTVTAPPGNAWSRFSAAFPALVLAQLALVACAVAQGVSDITASGGQTWTIAGIAAAQAMLMLLRVVPIMLLLSLPLLALRRNRLRLVALGTLWSLFVAIQAALNQYFQVAHVPLGADLFGYSMAEIHTTLSGTPFGLRSVLAFGLPLLLLWGGLMLGARRNAGGGMRRTSVLLIAGLLA